MSHEALTREQSRGLKLGWAVKNAVSDAEFLSLILDQRSVYRASTTDQHHTARYIIALMYKPHASAVGDSNSDIRAKLRNGGEELCRALRNPIFGVGRCCDKSPLRGWRAQEPGERWLGDHLEVEHLGRSQTKE